MAKVKYSKIGLRDIIYFSNKPKERERAIERTPATRLIEEYEVNKKARERHPDSQEFVIDKVIELDKSTSSYVLKKKDGSNPAYFRAGQYVVVRQKIDGKLIARPVSLCSTPNDTLKGIYIITVKEIPDGFLSKYIHSHWKKGDVVHTSGPQGTFYYEGLRDAKNVVAVAGGSGITPLLSMAQSIADGETSSIVGDEDFNLTILYGCRKEKDILFKDQLDDIVSKTKKVKVVYVLSNEKVRGYETGFIDAKLIKKYLPKQGRFSIFASGPQAMYRFLDKEVAKLDIERKYYRKELFGSIKDPSVYKGFPKDLLNKTFTATIKICDKEYKIPCKACENILVALERAGIAGPNRCRGGVCGWCRSRLLKGRVFIPDDTDGRRAADKVYNYIHPCASFALSDITIEVPFNK